MADTPQSNIAHTTKKLQELQLLFGSGIELVKPNRQFIRSAVMDKLCRGGPQPYYFHLFSDILIYSTEKKKNELKIHAVIPLSQCRISHATRLNVNFLPLLEEGWESQAFTLESPRKSFLVNAYTPREKDEWLLAMMRQQRSFKFSSLNKLDFAPILVPDKIASRCTICDTKFSFLTPKRHCKSCGIVVCAKCSPQRIMIPTIRNSPVRICNTCDKRNKEDTIEEDGSTSDNNKDHKTQLSFFADPHDNYSDDEKDPTPKYRPKQKAPLFRKLKVAASSRNLHDDSWTPRSRVLPSPKASRTSTENPRNRLQRTLSDHALDNFDNPWNPTCTSGSERHTRAAFGDASPSDNAIGKGVAELRHEIDKGLSQPKLDPQKIMKALLDRKKQRENEETKFVARRSKARPGVRLRAFTTFDPSSGATPPLPSLPPPPSTYSPTHSSANRRVVLRKPRPRAKTEDLPFGETPEAIKLEIAMLKADIDILQITKPDSLELTLKTQTLQVKQNKLKSY